MTQITKNDLNHAGLPSQENTPKPPEALHKTAWEVTQITYFPSKEATSS